MGKVIDFGAARAARAAKLAGAGWRAAKCAGCARDMAWRPDPAATSSNPCCSLGCAREIARRERAARREEPG